MPLLDLEPYGLPLRVDVTGELRHSASSARPCNDAPVVLLIDEHHDSPAAIDENVRNVSRILTLAPDAVIVLEHFPVGDVVTADSDWEFGSDFHQKLLSEYPAARLVGGDDSAALSDVNDVSTPYDDAIDALDPNIRNPRPAHEVATEEARLRAEAKDAIGKHPAQFVRSKRLIETVLQHVSPAARVGIINAGANSRASARFPAIIGPPGGRAGLQAPAGAGRRLQA